MEFQGLGGIAGLGAAFVLVLVLMYTWRESRKHSSDDEQSPG